MKFIFLLTIILNLHLLATSEVVLGSYSSQNGANKIKVQMDKIIKNDKRFKNFLQKNSIRSIVKEKGTFFIVTLGPINDIVTQHAIINRVKKTQFRDAYVLKLTKPIVEDEEETLMQEEPELQNIKVSPQVRQNKRTTQVKYPQTKKQKNYDPANLLELYFNELLATIAILLLSIIYLFIKRRQQTTNDFASYAAKKEPLSQVNTSIEKIPVAKIPSSKKKEIPQDEEESIFELKNEGEIAFDAFDEKKEEKSETVTSNVIKKEIKKHKDTSKSDFKDFNGMRIMIAEDNIINQKVIQGLLSDSGIEIVIADDGKEALSILELDSNFCIILMDAHMPNMDGYEATKQIRANSDYDHITIVALSGDTALDDVNKMKAIGMQEHLEKPLKMDPLYDIFNAYSYMPKVTANTKELDTQKGLEICGGDEDFYKEILNDFVKNYSDSNKYISELLNSKLFEATQGLLLDISSLSANIGADKVGELASALRVSLDAPQSANYHKFYKEYAKHFDALENEVKAYL